MGKVNHVSELFSNRVPTDFDKHVGIEIEFVSVYSRETLADMIFDHPSDIRDYVTVKTDSSIECDGGLSCGCHCSDCHGCSECSVEPEDQYGLELCVLAKQSELSKVMRLVGKFLREIKATVNPSCGLHVHLDMRKRDPKAAYKNLFTAQDALFSMVPLSRRHNTFCKKNTYKTVDAQGRTDSRYVAINVCSLREHETLEIRLHHGTVSTQDIECWAKLLCLIADSDLKRKVTSGKDLPKHLKLNKKIQKYVKSKTKKYSEVA